SRMRSASVMFSSKPMRYVKPEQPPPTTMSRRPASGLMLFFSISWVMSFLSSSAAFGVSFTVDTASPRYGYGRLPRTLARRGGDPCPGRSGSPERRRHYYRGAREEGNQEGGPGRGGGRSEFPLYGRRAGLK